MKKLFTSESVTEGHPDKVSDYVSDAVLDACLEQDQNSRVAIETQVKTVIDTLGTHHYLNLAGELTTRAKLDLKRVVRKALQDIGYDADEKGFNYHTANINLHISPQSPDIDLGVLPERIKSKAQEIKG